MRTHPWRDWTPAAVFLGLLLGGCSSPLGPLTPVEIREDFSTIAEPHARWEAYGLKTYRLEETRACECLPPHRWTATIENGKVTEVEVEPVEGYDPRTLHDAALEMAWTVDDEFDLVRRGEREADRQPQVTYDPRFGFPTNVYIDWNLGLADEETYHTSSKLVKLARH